MDVILILILKKVRIMAMHSKYGLSGSNSLANFNLQLTLQFSLTQINFFPRKIRMSFKEFCKVK